MEIAIGTSSSRTAITGEAQNYQPFQLKQAKLDFPRFDGSESLQWLFRAKQFFNYYETLDAQRITIAADHRDGSATTWFPMM